MQTGLPKGVVNLVNGGKPAVDALLDHPAVQAISFVGSTPVARYIYARAAANGKRVQCQGGAKNHVVVLPDADPRNHHADRRRQRLRLRRAAVPGGFGRGDGGRRARMVPKIDHRSCSVYEGGRRPRRRRSNGPSDHSRKQAADREPDRQGAAEGAKAALDGRGAKIAGYERRQLRRADGSRRRSGIERADRDGDLRPGPQRHSRIRRGQAIEIITRSSYGNASSIFTSSGAAARRFRNQISTGNVGVNIGVAAPMAYFPFSGWKGSFFGVLHAQGRDAVEFYTDKKVVIERWPKEWSRKF